MEGDSLTRYNGGKNGAGVYQTIINAIPEHSVYIEAFAGSAAIFRRKRHAASSYLIERDPAVVYQLRKLRCTPAPIVIEEDALLRLAALALNPLRGVFIYLDPPYLHSTRSRLDLYKFEMTEAQHLHLVASVLPALTAAGAKWALSGYRSAMYDDAAAASGWHRTDFPAMTRRGVRIESLWTNYDPAQIVPAELTYHGRDFRERERLKRMAGRWCAKLEAMPARDRAFMISAMLASTGRKGELGS